MPEWMVGRERSLATPRNNPRALALSKDGPGTISLFVGTAAPTVPFSTEP